jgi:hypothetical protein
MFSFQGLFSGTLSWDGGDCLSKRNFGEECSDANECLMSGDPHMDCLEASFNFTSVNDVSKSKEITR